MQVIDISHIYGWAGLLSGIERVEYNLIKYSLSTDQYSYAMFSEKENRFIVLSKKYVEDFIRRIEEVQQSIPQEKVGPLVRVLKKIVRKNVDTIDDGQIDCLIILDGLWDKESYINSLLSLASKGTRLVHIIYDMIPVVQQGIVLDYMTPIFSNYMEKVLPVCSKVLAISRSSMNDCKKFLKDIGCNNMPEMQHFRLGDAITDSDLTKPPLFKETKFCLVAGTVEARKNHTLLLYAYKLANSRGQKLPKVVIAGKEGWLTNDLIYMIRHDVFLSSQIILLGPVDDRQLGWLYKNAMYSILPSFYEGWGLQISESLQYGTPVISSNTSSMPEVGGNLCDYFSPFSPEELVSLMLKYNNKKFLEKKRLLVESEYKSMGWEEAAHIFFKKARV